MTFDATVNPVVYEKGIPVFIDSEYDTWNIIESLLFGLILYFKFKSKESYELKFSMLEAKKMLVIGAPFIYSLILVNIYGQTDKIMLEAFSGYEALQR